MGMIKTKKLIFEYEKRDEEGNVIGSLQPTGYQLQQTEKLKRAGILL